MKPALLFILIASFAMASAQPTSYGDFKLADQEIVYQAIFQKENISYAELEKYYAKNKSFSGIKMNADEMTFEVKDLTVDYLKFQFSQVETPLILQTGKFSGQASVSVKDGRYRVTFRKIMVTGEIGYKSIKEKEPLTGLCSKSNGTQLSQEWMKPNTFGLLAKAFADNFELKTTDDDW